MRILHIDEQLGWRGGEQQASYLIRGLGIRGHEGLIAGRDGSSFMEKDHGVETLVRVPIHGRGDLDFRSGFTVARAMRKYAIDILHAHTSHALSYALIARSLGGRVKVVASRRVDFMPSRNALSRFKYNQADRVVAISNKIAEVMREFGLPDSKLTVVHSGIDPRRLDVSKLDRSRLGVPEGVPLIGNVAALVGHKDQATLLNAMAILLNEVPNARLVIAGDGPLRPQLETQIAELGIGHAVSLLGYRKDIPSLLRALDVFVLSSNEEGLGTSVLDAMACEIPVVATAAGGIPEMVEDGITGVLVKPRDSKALANGIIGILRNPATAAKQTTNALGLVNAKFTVERMVEGNCAVYESVLASH